MVGKRGAHEAPRKHIEELSSPRRKYDIENGPPTKFRDVVDDAMTDRRNSDLKKQLLSGIKREAFEEFRKSEDELKAIKNKKVRQFYEAQNDRLNDWLEVDTIVQYVADDVIDSMNPDADHDGIRDRQTNLNEAAGGIEGFLPDEVQKERQKGARNARWAININIIANILLLAAKGFAALKSNSLSLLASLADSALDLLCTGIIWTTNRLVSWRLKALAAKFPVGRRRLEPLGTLVFSVIMVFSFAQILQESIIRLLPSADHKTATLPVVAIAAMGGTVIIKGIIGLGCIRVKTTQVQALAQDCKTDVYFNTLSLAFPLIGKHAGVWWLDPLGAALLSLFVIYDWADTAFSNVTRLCGSAVDESLLKKLTYLAYRFTPVVDGFKNITAYHAGDGIWVEYDILLSETTTLRHTHDVAETLQYCAEALQEVDRAFVTVDYSSVNPHGHSTT